MFCIQCGVELADTEKKCPLCNTVVYHPEIKQSPAQPLYPARRLPQTKSGRAALSGAAIILFLIPLLVCFFADFGPDGKLQWFGYVFGGVAISYIAVALPLWFQKPNPVIFLPCDFAAIGLFLLYINFASGGDWFLSFALPCLGGVCLIACAVLTLLYYLRRGTLYILGGALMALGGFMLPVEFLMDAAFGLAFIGWSVYPLIVFMLLGGLLIYLAINRTARETLERKLFF